MARVTISLPEKLKSYADTLVERGYYSSFSDLIRTALRSRLRETKYDIWAEEAKKELTTGGASVLKDGDDIDNFLENI